jgi:hypothetical protein
VHSEIGAEAVALISSNIWKSRYAASRDVLGRKVTVNATTPATIIGLDVFFGIHGHNYETSSPCPRTGRAQRM